VQIVEKVAVIHEYGRYYSLGVTTGIGLGARLIGLPVEKHLGLCVFPDG
jgi:hypothetical protein